MTSGTSPLAKIMGAFQRNLHPLLATEGFRSRGRAFNRTTSEGLAQVIQLQMGRFDPPGTNYIPGLTQNLYGQFRINVGVFVPEVEEILGLGPVGPIVREWQCHVRTTLGQLSTPPADIWWEIRNDAATLMEVVSRLQRDALPFLRQMDTRDGILARLLQRPSESAPGGAPRIVCAIILARRGQVTAARSLLMDQVRLTDHAPHHGYVREIAEKIGLGALDI